MSLPTEKLVEIVIEGLRNNKAKDIHVLNLKNLENAVSEYFIVCHGTSKTHVSSTAPRTNSLTDSLRAKLTIIFKTNTSLKENVDFK